MANVVNAGFDGVDMRQHFRNLGRTGEGVFAESLNDPLQGRYVGNHSTDFADGFRDFGGVSKQF